MTSRVVLVGIDGATFTLLDPLMEQGVMPNLRRFVERGTRAYLDSVVPPLTPPAWVTLMTGRSPGVHGILDFFTPTAPGSLHLRTPTSHHVTAEYVWQMAGRAGHSVTAINYPYMTPPRRLNGYSMSGWIPWRHLRRACYPPELFEEVKGFLGFGARDMGMDLKVEAKCIDGCSVDEYEEWIELHTRRERNWMDTLRYLMETHPTDLTAVLFDGSDKLQHLCWRFVDPVFAADLGTEEEKHIREQCLDLYRQLDRFIAEIGERAGPEATVILASDHGFGASVETFYLNTWLHHHGYLVWAEGAPADDSIEGRVGLEALGKLSFMLDWSRTTAHTITSSSNGIRIRVRREPGDGGIAPEDYPGFRSRLADELRSWVDPATGTPVVTRVWTREEAFGGPHMGEAPDLTLRVRDHGLVSLLKSDTFVRPRPTVMGMHRPEGIFLAAGPHVREGARLDAHLSLLDIAPLLLHALGVPVPANLEGHVPTDIFRPDWMASHPVRTGAPTEVMHGLPAATRPEADPEGDLEVLERLRALGYVE